MSTAAQNLPRIVAPIPPFPALEGDPTFSILSAPYAVCTLPRNKHPTSMAPRRRLILPLVLAA